MIVCIGFKYPKAQVEVAYRKDPLAGAAVAGCWFGCVGLVGPTGALLLEPRAGSLLVDNVSSKSMTSTSILRPPSNDNDIRILLHTSSEQHKDDDSWRRTLSSTRYPV